MQGLPLALFVLAALPAGAEIRGAAMAQKPEPAIWTWGTELRAWDVRGNPMKVLIEGANFGAGGCVADVDGDGRDDLLAQEQPGLGRFVWLQAPSWRKRVIEARTEFQECLPATLHGRRGVLVLHRYAQLRFYEFPKKPDAAWAYEELYSIYTPSKQGGLALADMDGDGQQDVMAGNYWVRNPGKPRQAWRLFTMNTYFDTADAAQARIAVVERANGVPSAVVWASAWPEGGRLSLLRRPEDAHQLWEAQRMEPAPVKPSAVWPGQLSGMEVVLVGHADGVWLYRKDGAGWKQTRLGSGFRVIALFVVNDQVLAVSPEGVMVVYPLR